jgi:hypothetical protein
VVWTSLTGSFMSHCPGNLLALAVFIDIHLDSLGSNVTFCTKVTFAPTLYSCGVSSSSPSSLVRQKLLSNQ